MGFNELNSVEHYIIHQLSGLNLNTEVQEPALSYGVQWVFKSSEELQRSVNEVLVESELKEALIRLNSDIASKPELADKCSSCLRRAPRRY